MTKRKPEARNVWYYQRYRPNIDEVDYRAICFIMQGMGFYQTLSADKV